MKLRQRFALARAAITGRVTTAPLRARMAGAGHSRLMEGWSAYCRSIDETVRFELTTLRARARQLVEDNGEAMGLLLDFESDIVGPKGAILQFRARKPRAGPRDALNDRVEASFAKWGMRGVCTMDGFDDFASLQRLVIRTVIVDGEFFAIKHRNRSLAHGFALQPIDPDQVDADYNVEPNGDGAAVVMGVQVDRYGKPQGYYVWDGHPSSRDKGERRFVPASDMVHVYKRIRPGQTRGITWFAAALVTWKLGDQYTESELVQSMLAAAQGGFFENAEGVQAFPTRQEIDPSTGEARDVPIEFKAEPGISQALPAGWTFKAWQPTHPTANYVGFMKAVKRIIARAFGRSYATLTGDLSDVNFSSMRTDRVREMDQNKLHQADILVRQFCAPVFADWLAMADLKGVVGSLPSTPAELLVFATWMCRGWPWIDPVKDATAAKLELDMGATSPQRICAAKGVDFYEIVDEIADAKAYCDEKKVTLDVIALSVAVDVSTDTTDAESPAARTLRLAA